MAECPLPLDVLPKPLQKHADGKAPAPLRMMGAKGLVPAVAPIDLCTLLFMLAFDADAGVRDTAVRTAEGLPDKIWGVALRAEGLDGRVLDWLADRFATKETAIEFVLLNPSTLDDTVARLAPAVSQRLADIVRQNELRLLRHEGILRGLCENPNALASTVDGACDFCVRNGLTLLDVHRSVEAYKRIHGVDPTVKPPEPVETAAALMQEFGQELAHDVPAPRTRRRRSTSPSASCRCRSPRRSSSRRSGTRRRARSSCATPTSSSAWRRRRARASPTARSSGSRTRAP
jgi:hypothetical protein